MVSDKGLSPPVGKHVQKSEKVKKVYTWQCGYCGQDFDTENYSQRYCNPTHKELAYRLRKATKQKDGAVQQNLLTL